MSDESLASDGSRSSFDSTSGAIFRAIYDQSSHLMGVLDLDGRVCHANRAACEFINERLDHLVGVPFWDTPWWAHSEEERCKLQDAFSERAVAMRFSSTPPIGRRTARFTTWTSR